MYSCKPFRLSKDGVGSQLIGGFKEGAGAHLKCRHCMRGSNAWTSKVNFTCAS